MKFNAQFFSALLPKLIVNTCLLSVSSSSIYAVAAQQTKAERWFEVEVILFKQLGDKNSLTEQFSKSVNAKTLPHYKHSIDLLTPYLQPDLTAIKQFIPLCSSTKGESHFSLIQDKPVINLLEQEKFIQQASSFTYEPIELVLSNEDDSEGFQSNDELEALSNNQTIQPVQVEVETAQTINQENSQDIRQVNPNLVFNWQTAALNSPLFSSNSLCVYSQKDFNNILDEQALASFNLDAFAVTALPKKLKASGAHLKHSPYLIADESLLLKDINTRLGWSKEFKPLLHFGWRQVGITRKKAIPFKLFAGHHLENDFQQASKDYQIEVKEAQQQEQLMFEQLQLTSNITNSEVITINSAELNKVNDTDEQAKRDYYARIKQQSLSQLFADITTIETSDTQRELVDETIKQLSSQSLDDLLSVEEATTNDNEQPLDITTPPKEPLQAWLLDGFFKINLDHYLYITADFNVLSEAFANTALDHADKNEMKLINFSQNRRVITGEIHYFDHPYIGMIVQIRRFDPTKSADKAVSQAIK